MTTATSSSNRDWWLGILAITLLGGLLRFGGIGVQSFWYDEAYSARIAEQSTTWELFTGEHKDNGNPPLYYIAHRWTSEIFGKSEAGQRMFAAVCGVLTIPIIGLLAWRLCNQRAGLIAAGLFALSPLSVELSNEARVYSFLHFITALDALLLVNWLSSQKWRDGLAYLVVTALACYSHYFVVFFVFSHLFAVLTVPHRKQAFLRWCVLMLGVAALWAAWAPAFLEQLRTPGNLSRMASAWKMQFASTPIVFSVGRTFAWRDASKTMLGLAAIASLIGFCIPAFVGWVKLFRTNRPQAVLLAGWVAFPILIPLIVAILKTPIYHHRYGSVALSGFVCLAAIGLSALPMTLNRLSAAVIVCATAYSLTNYFTQPMKDDWRSASRSVLANGPADQLVLTDSDIEVVPFLYYARQAGQVPAEIYGLTGSENVEERLNAVKYEQGKKSERNPSDHSNRILTAPSICLALCLPEHSLEEYQRLFEQHGYELKTEEQFYRITIVRFERRAELTAQTPDAGMP